MRLKYRILTYLLVALVIIISSEIFNKKSFNDSFYVKEYYREQFTANCGVTSLEDSDFERGGTGTLLNNGLIITAKHVVDIGEDGYIDDDEKTVLIKFYYPVEFNCKASVVYCPKERLRISTGFDFVFLKPDIDMNSNILVATSKECLTTGVGEEIYTIGRMDGNRPHFTAGNKSTRLKDYMYERTDLDIYYGNSGGGVFRERDGILLGLVITKRESKHFPPRQLWTGYMSIYDIRYYLKQEGKEWLLNSAEVYYGGFVIVALSIYFISVSIFIGVYFGKSV
jgi:hypothetical protein